ncbi:TNF receptor-associated factor 1 [Vulpes lagopus]|uniref:TNF receptor-associated factor 1 n=1 Tax=Vulpes lagopus TaxID=494514 RepID=UPI001BC8CDCF|nr:TNF receptor-associated factor 1 [Vulpes lagopus]
MASGSASSPRPAPDENEFPFGCPPVACQEPAEPRALRCAACLPENVRSGEDRICPKCQGDDPQSGSPGSPLSQEKDPPEVTEAEVGCPFAGVGCPYKRPWTCYRVAAAPHPSRTHTLQRLTKEKPLAELQEKLRVFENIVAVLNKEVEASHLALAASIHQSQLDREHILSLEQQVAELQQTLAQKDQALGKLEQSLRLTEEASFDGTFLWKITNVTRRCHESACGRTVSLFSPAFYTAKYGYKLCLRLYLNGDGTGKRTHLSLFIVIMRGEYDALLPWPFRNKVTFMLLDQNNREHAIDAFRPDLSSASFQRPQSETNVASGCPLFFPLSRLQSPKHAYVKDDTMFLKCIVETNA